MKVIIKRMDWAPKETQRAILIVIINSKDNKYFPQEIQESEKYTISQKINITHI